MALLFRGKRWTENDDTSFYIIYFVPYNITIWAIVPRRWEPVNTSTFCKTLFQNTLLSKLSQPEVRRAWSQVRMKPTRKRNCHAIVQKERHVEWATPRRSFCKLDVAFVFQTLYGKTLSAGGHSKPVQASFERACMPALVWLEAVQNASRMARMSS